MLPSDLFDMACRINTVAVQAHRRAPRVLVEHVNPPIPVRSHDYRATFDGYEPGDPMGWGETPDQAAANLREVDA